ncbi:MAG: WecB/TagA/CpsF family glycosyltransferase, partial [Thiotrichaceae bacterium]
MIINKAVEKIKILSVSVTAFDSYSHAVESIIDRIKKGQKSLCVAINPEKIYRVQSDIELKEVINTADIHICDGVGVVIATKILYGRRIRRITGIQLFCDLVARAEKEGLKIFILGASTEANKGACEKLLAKHPNLQIAGRQNGYCNDTSAVIRMINDSGADMLFVAMGSPKQEFWIAEHKDAINAP